jgi:hypothetical protein
MTREYVKKMPRVSRAVANAALPTKSHLQSWRVLESRLRSHFTGEPVSEQDGGTTVAAGVVSSLAGAGTQQRQQHSHALVEGPAGQSSRPVVRLLMTNSTRVDAATVRRLFTALGYNATDVFFAQRTVVFVAFESAAKRLAPLASPAAALNRGLYNAGYAPRHHRLDEVSKSKVAPLYDSGTCLFHLSSLLFFVCFSFIGGAALRQWYTCLFGFDLLVTRNRVTGEHAHKIVFTFYYIRTNSIFFTHLLSRL